MSESQHEETILAAFEPKRTMGRYRVSDIGVDPRVQRPLDQRRVDDIVSEFDPAAVGVLTISMRDDATIVCLDGQHRAAALRVLGLAEQERDMVCYEALTIQEEARLFRLLNNTKRPNVMNLFRTAVTEGKPEEVAVDKLVQRHGYVAESGHRNSVMAVKTLLRIYKMGKDPANRGLVLDRVFYAVVGTWGVQADAVHTTILGSLGAVLARYGDAVDINRLCEKLKKDKRTSDPAAFVGRARASADATRKNVVDAAAEIIVGAHNAYLKQNQLPDW